MVNPHDGGKHMKRAKQRRLRPGAVIPRVLFLAIVAYLAVTMITTQVEIVAKRQQLDNVTAQVTAQQAQNDELQRALETDNEDAYIERVAREKLGYALPGERVYVDVSGR